MGLGKTVQATGATILRNAISSAKGQAQKPSLVICPNEVVLNLWKQHFLKSGVEEEKIIRFKTKRRFPLESKDNILLCTRYDLQTEAKHIFQSLPPLPKYGESFLARPKKSPLFPRASENLLQVLDNQYKNTNGKSKNKYNLLNGVKVSNEMVVTSYIRKEERDMSVAQRSDVFRMVIIDEAVRYVFVFDGWIF